MISDAIDTAITLGWALLAWIVLTSAVAVLALYAVAVVVGCVCVTVWRVARGVWRWLRRARRGAGDSRDAGDPPGPSQAPSRPAPPWAHTDKEAA
ncbi:hypothetical protein ABZT03_43145 [Streptomyces sp. NPDC005574]|uniref:hypothetical protein n=1 Tax=Streptomyces sp. NPDC005574 TaxID=3156891 RepID=UPI0033B48939